MLPAPAETQTQTQTPARYVAGRVRVDGMTCDACVNSILRVLTDKYGLVDGAPGTFRSRAPFLCVFVLRFRFFFPCLFIVLFGFLDLGFLLFVALFIFSLFLRLP